MVREYFKRTDYRIGARGNGGRGDAQAKAQSLCDDALPPTQPCGAAEQTSVFLRAPFREEPVRAHDAILGPMHLLQAAEKENFGPAAVRGLRRAHDGSSNWANTSCAPSALADDCGGPVAVSSRRFGRGAISPLQRFGQQVEASQLQALSQQPSPDVGAPPRRRNSISPGPLLSAVPTSYAVRPSVTAAGWGSPAKPAVSPAGAGRLWSPIPSPPSPSDGGGQGRGPGEDKAEIDKLKASLAELQQRLAGAIQQAAVQARR